MARTTLAVQSLKTVATAQADGTGLTPAFTAANADGHSVTNDGKTSVRIKTSGTGCTVTIPHGGTSDGLAVNDLSVTLTATDEQELPLLGPGFNQPDTQVFWINFSAVTGVTVAAISTR